MQPSPREEKATQASSSSIEATECGSAEGILPKLSPTNTVDLQAPTKDELQNLRRVSGAVPWVAWLLCLVELAERASYSGARQVFANFLQQPLPPGTQTLI
jgi:hypothetical protein